MAATKTQTNKQDDLQTKIVKGIKVTINPKILMDWDILMTIAEVLGGEFDPNDFSDALNRIKKVEGVMVRIFGENQYQDIKEGIKKLNGGILPVDSMMDFVNDVFNEFQGKN